MQIARPRADSKSSKSDYLRVWPSGPNHTLRKEHLACQRGKRRTLQFKLGRAVNLPADVAGKKLRQLSGNRWVGSPVWRHLNDPGRFCKTSFGFEPEGHQERRRQGPCTQPQVECIAHSLEALSQPVGAIRALCRLLWVELLFLVCFGSEIDFNQGRQPKARDTQVGSCLFFVWLLNRLGPASRKAKGDGKVSSSCFWRVPSWWSSVLVHEVC